MRVTEDTIKFIKRLEGFKSSPYKEAKGVWTIGYGFTYHPKTKKKLTGKEGSISEKEADVLLRGALQQLLIRLKRVVKKELTDNQADAVMSFAYNVGMENFKKSDLLKTINIDPYHQDIPFYFSNWHRVGKKLYVLKSRREQEILKYGQVKQGGKALLWNKRAVVPRPNGQGITGEYAMEEVGGNDVGVPEESNIGLYLIIAGVVCAGGYYFYKQNKKGNGSKRK